MASEDTVLGNAFKVQIGDAGSPEQFSDACSIVDLQNLGETRSQEQVTAYCDSKHQYISGLDDGNEVTIVGNLIMDATDLVAIFARWDAQAPLTMRFALKTDPDNTYLEFTGPLLSWSLQPPVAGRAQLQFTTKLSNLIRVGFPG